jgi:(2S)-methylsuccinyl-CoA dehydrogenase
MQPPILDPKPLHDVAASDELRRLRRMPRTPRFSQARRCRCEPGPGEPGDVPMDEQTAMARDAFRRFAEDVVAPMAEEIHRHNLTVPESLLQPYA